MKSVCVAAEGSRQFFINVIFPADSSLRFEDFFFCRESNILPQEVISLLVIFCLSVCLLLCLFGVCCLFLFCFFCVILFCVCSIFLVCFFLFFFLTNFDTWIPVFKFVIFNWTFSSYNTRSTGLSFIYYISSFLKLLKQNQEKNANKYLKTMLTTWTATVNHTYWMKVKTYFPLYRAQAKF